MRLPNISMRRLIERAGIAGVVLAGHAAVVMLMGWEMQPVAVSDPGNDGQTVMVSLVTNLPASSQASPARARTQPPRPKPEKAEPAADHSALAPTDPLEATEAIDDTPVLSEAETQAVEAFDVASELGDPGAACNFSGMLAGALAQSPAVRLGLDELPDDQRSVANAVMLWDGQWPGDTRTGGKAVLRALLVKAVSVARPECLTAEQRGPALFLVPDNSRTVVLAVGSGVWTWGDLLASPASTEDYLLTAASGFPATP